MKAAVATEFGQPDAVIRMATDRPKPSIQPGKVLVHVHACSLSPGDYRTILGDCDLVRTPASWPYIPGGDVCGACTHFPVIHRADNIQTYGSAQI